MNRIHSKRRVKFFYFEQSYGTDMIEVDGVYQSEL